LLKRRVAGLFALLVLFFLSGTVPSSANETGLSSSQEEAVEEAVLLTKKKKWKKARTASEKIESPLIAKILHWIDLIDQDSEVSFETLDAFINANPDWPGQYLLQRRAEESMQPAMSDEAVIKWFENREPKTADGAMRLGQALLATGQSRKAKDLLRKTWIDGNFGKRQERQFYRRYREHLTYQDHLERLDRLIWEDRYYPARRMLKRVKPDQRKLAEARLALMRKRGGVDRAIAKVPEELKNDPRLVYERLRWRRRKGRYMDARELLDPAPRDMIQPTQWWPERSILARQALNEGHISEAYRYVAEHGLGEGADFAEAEWMAGWIALRYLNEAGIAYKHFTDMFEAVNYPISLARAAYWAGRAAEDLKKTELARDWYRAAARHSTAYYGQLAAAKLRPKAKLILPPDIQPTDAEKDGFEKFELVQAIRLLPEIGLDDYARIFFMALDRAHPTSGWRSLTAKLAYDVERPDLAIVVAKRAIRDGHGFLSKGYPQVDLPEKAPESALVHAVIRQESAFSPGAISRVGARGLMQLMPRTAKKVAQRESLKYSMRKLLEEPDYNLKIGQSYLAGLIEKFDGSYILALTSYNAGPYRTRRWMEVNGDPRDSTVDPVDWVEMIPFSETRNYVQRVLENLQVYRSREKQTEVAYNLEKDLRRTFKTHGTN